jgi:hypothetical protein
MMEPSKRESRGIVPSALAITGFLLMFADATWAQQRYPIGLSVQASETTYTQQLAIEVGDSPNHQVRIYEIRRRHTNAPLTFRDVKVTESWSRGTSDYADYSGQTTGYSIYNLENGDRILARYTGTVQSVSRPDGTREYVYHGVTTFTGGTGAFRNIRGYMRDVTKGASKGGKALSNEVTGEGEYWFEE